MQGRGLGSGLLLDAMSRTLQVADIVGVRALAVHAKDNQQPSSIGISGSNRCRQTRITCSGSSRIFARLPGNPSDLPIIPLHK